MRDALKRAALLFAFGRRAAADLSAGESQRLNSEPLPGPRAGVSVKPAPARMLGELVEYVRATTQPGERVGAMPYLPIALFLAERFAPHPASYIVWPFPEYPDRDRRVADALEDSCAASSTSRPWTRSPAWRSGRRAVPRSSGC